VEFYQTRDRGRLGGGGSVRLWCCCRGRRRVDPEPGSGRQKDQLELLSLEKLSRLVGQVAEDEGVVNALEDVARVDPALLSGRTVGHK